MPVFIKRRWISLRRQGARLMRYWPSPERKTRRVMVTSWYSIPRMGSQSVRVRLTSAIARGRTVSVPLKMTSVMVLLRRDFGDCSPRTQRMASETLLLPQPLGPTMAIMPGSKFRVVRSAKDLKPIISIDLRYMGMGDRDGNL